MKTIKSLFSGALITLLCLFVNVTISNAQSSPKDFRRIKTIQTIQIKKDLYVLNLNMTVPLFSEPLQRYLSSKMFKNEDSLLLSAINDYIEQHRPEENKLSRSKVDTLDFELYSVSYKPDKYISMFMRYPDIHSLANVSDGIYEIRDCIKSFIYDLKKDRILNYSDIFSPQYFNLLLNVNEQNILTRHYSNDYSYELDDDYLSYGEKTFVKLPLIQAKNYFTEDFKDVIDWNIVEHRADSLQLRGTSVKDMQEDRTQQIQNIIDSLQLRGISIKEMQEDIAQQIEDFIGGLQLRGISLKEMQEDGNQQFEDVIGGLLASEVSYDNLNYEEGYIAYKNDNDPFNTIHLYMKDKECWVSGLNKDINKLTESELNFLSSKSKWIIDDIAVMKKWMKQQNGSSEDDRIYTQGDFEKKMNLKQNINNYIRKRLNNDMNFFSIPENIIVMISYVIDEEGHIVCPVILRGKDIDCNKKFVNYLRKYKKCPVFLEDGSLVKMRIQQFFSYHRFYTNTP